MKLTCEEMFLIVDALAALNPDSEGACREVGSLLSRFRSLLPAVPEAPVLHKSNNPREFGCPKCGRTDDLQHAFQTWVWYRGGFDAAGKWDFETDSYFEHDTENMQARVYYCPDCGDIFLTPARVFPGVSIIPE